MANRPQCLIAHRVTGPSVRTRGRSPDPRVRSRVLECELRIAPGPQPFEGRPPAVEGTRSLRVEWWNSRVQRAGSPRHLAVCVTSRGPTIERRSDGRAGCQQQDGQIRFDLIDVGLDARDRIPSSEERFRVAMARPL
jgi:hypothetical protein